MKRPDLPSCKPLAGFKQWVMGSPRRWNFAAELLCFRSAAALYRKSNLCISRKGIARPQSQFIHLCVCERFIYSQDWSAYLTDCSWKYINLSQINDCRNWEIEHYNSVLEITRQHCFISGNTEIGTRHLYWPLALPLQCAFHTLQSTSRHFLRQLG